MKSLRLGVVFLVFLFVGVSHSQKQVNEWRGLVPLHSTRTDVEKIFGLPIKTSTNAFYESVYETTLEQVIVRYSEGDCQEYRYSVWDVPKDVVISVTVSPKNNLNIPKFLKHFPQKFNRLVDVHMPNRVHYTNHDSSVGFLTRVHENGDEDLIFFSITPGETDNRLRCVRPKKTPHRLGVRLAILRYFSMMLWADPRMS